jgi:hypothetical protein
MPEPEPKKEPKVARDAAELELDIWCETLEHDPDKEDRATLLSALMAGRITFDAATETFTYALRTPIELETGARLPHVKIADITARQFADAFKSIKVNATDKTASVSMDAILLQLSAASGIALGVVERVKNRDFSVLQALIGFFG